jgi:hypothetical protein
VNERLYTEEEVALALRRAGESENPAGLTHTEVLAAALEAGIAPRDMERELAAVANPGTKDEFLATLPFEVDPSLFPEALADLPNSAMQSATMVGSTLTGGYDEGLVRLMFKICKEKSGTTVRVTLSDYPRNGIATLVGLVGLGGLLFMAVGEPRLGIPVTGFVALVLAFLFAFPSKRHAKLEKAGRAIVARLHQIHRED